MIGEIIAIGDELTSGRILNTTSGYAARKLFEAGHTIHAMSTIGDAPALIGEALLQAITRVDFIIVTGGLGSTDDDLTNEAVSRALNRPTMPNLDILAQIRTHLHGRSAAPDDPLEKLAWLPSGAEAFDPSAAIAGYQLVHDDTPIFFLPGVPEEMIDLLNRIVLPKLAAWQPESGLVTCQRIYKIFGVAESEVNRCISTLNLAPPIRIGYYPVFPDVHLSVLIRATEKDDSRTRFETACRRVETALGSAIYGRDNDELEAIVGALLKKSGRWLATAESCSGGLLAHRVTRVAGSSSYFVGGAVVYANRLKSELLGVDPDLIERCGAVSSDVAAAMASGIRERCRTDIGVAITGIAGPDGGTDAKPIGTVFIGMADGDNCRVTRCRFSGDRHRIQNLAVHTGLNLLRLHLQGASEGETETTADRS
ncbi:CinA family nicotinamide mononucleotide deamidase-related protein [Desulfofustis glycolicus]|uniref:CinA-like protein n=1 Tax=Desulfofustis glycolicus DSM 9705 TaxID=1121409 RepID=A0A1M5XLH5_9BACT|nr:CinA family nicotinamide mononucleotide deamidase-related protein [Desulfofustis glycolicus]MCB2216647.1 CinA family nicotinamide mononucleotide deamidase-related protein [Desulfobulbaceae bacterium]SHI00687.1 competence/damage-inducible protein cinA [Desulfofustis glycolicus DSM 9705]